MKTDLLVCHEVWFGAIEFGEFIKGRDSFSCALIHELHNIVTMPECEADDYMVANRYDGYLIPSLFDGEIYYSRRAA